MFLFRSKFLLLASSSKVRQVCLLSAHFVPLFYSLTPWTVNEKNIELGHVVAHDTEDPMQPMVGSLEKTSLSFF